jgi:hypothetical protein
MTPQVYVKLWSTDASAVHPAELGSLVSALAHGTPDRVVPSGPRGYSATCAGHGRFAVDFREADAEAAPATMVGQFFAELNLVGCRCWQGAPVHYEVADSPL